MLLCSCQAGIVEIKFQTPLRSPECNLGKDPAFNRSAKQVPWNVNMCQFTPSNLDDLNNISVGRSILLPSTESAYASLFLPWLWNRMHQIIKMYFMLMSYYVWYHSKNHLPNVNYQNSSSTRKHCFCSSLSMIIPTGYPLQQHCYPYRSALSSLTFILRQNYPTPPGSSSSQCPNNKVWRTNWDRLYINTIIYPTAKSLNAKHTCSISSLGTSESNMDFATSSAFGPHSGCDARKPEPFNWITFREGRYHDFKTLQHHQLRS